MKISKTLKIICIFLTLSMTSAMLSWAQAPPQEILDRNLRSVYYETTSFGSIPLKISLNDLVKNGFINGVWENEKINIWKYTLYISDKSGYKKCLSLFFTVVDDVNLQKCFENDVVLTKILIDGQPLRNSNVFDLVLPVALDIYYEKSKNERTLSLVRYADNN